MIYIIGHKPLNYGFWDNDIYRPIQVGGNEKFLYLRDNESPDNISALNWLWAENTATYHIWKNCKDEGFKGQVQYRRRLKFDTKEEIVELLSKHGAIVPSHLNYNPLSQYYVCHSKKDMELSRGIIEEKYPDLLEGWKDNIENGKRLLYSDSFVMVPEDYDEWAEFLFGFGDEFIRRSWGDAENAYTKITEEMDSGIRKGKCPKGDNGMRYQHQVLAFLTERLLTMWIYTKYGNPLEVPYVKMENI